MIAPGTAQPRWTLVRPNGHPLPIVLGLFIAAMVVPADLTFKLEDLRFDAHRVLLLLIAPTVLIGSMAPGFLRLHDWMILTGAAWAVTACFMNMPEPKAIERGGAFFLETAIAYLLPTFFLTTVPQMRRLVRGLFVVVAILGVLAAMESISKEHFVANWAADVMDEPEPFQAEERLGLLRARVSFTHQILFGVFCASLLALFWFEATSHLGRAARALICFGAVFFSLSSAAILLFLLQAGMIWLESTTRIVRDRLRWGLLFALGSWGLIEMAVNGGVVGFVIRYLSLNPSTAYYRQLIWHHVTDDIADNPYWGTGGEWTRPHWMVESVDHVYFTKALKYGIPVPLLFGLAAVVIGIRLARRRAPPGSAHHAVTLGWTFAALGLGIAGLTVDYFGRALPFVMFIIGIGAAWLRIAERDPSVFRR